MDRRLRGSRVVARPFRPGAALVVCLLAVALILPTACNSGLALGLQDKIELEETSVPQPPAEDEGPFRVLESDYHSIKLGWEPATDKNLDTSRLEYLLGYLQTDGEPTAVDVMKDGIVALDWTAGVTEATIDGLNYGTNYTIALAVRDRAQNTAYYPVLSAATLLDSTPPAPGDMDPAQVTASSITVTWAGAEDDRGLTSPEDLEYKVVYSDTDPIDSVDNAETNGTLVQDWKRNYFSATIDNLIDNWHYAVAVLVRDAEENEAMYELVEVTTAKQPRLFFVERVYQNSRVAVFDPTPEVIEGSSITTIINEELPDWSYITQVEVDPVDRKLYIADREYGDSIGSPGVIMRCDFDGGNLEILISENLPDPYGLAIDGEGSHRFLYWTDKARDKIYRSPLPPSSTDAESYVLLDSSDGVDQPYDIAVDGSLQRIYWLQQGGDGYVRYANIDDEGDATLGTPELITTGESDPHAIAIWPDSSAFFWTSQTAGEIRSRGYQDIQNDLSVVLSTGLTTPRGITLDVETGTLYWTDEDEQKIYRRPTGSLETDAAQLSILDSINIATAVAIY